METTGSGRIVRTINGSNAGDGDSALSTETIALCPLAIRSIMIILSSVGTLLSHTLRMRGISCSIKSNFIAT